MLCEEGRLSIKCFLGTAGLVFTLTTSQNILGFTPNHIWGASLWGPVFYFVIICISLRLFLSDIKYQVSFPFKFKLVTLLIFIFTSVCHSSNILRIYIFLQYITSCFSTVAMESFWYIWNHDVNISLFRIFGDSMVKS